jgi:wyosine [tRNA(Phe)-imidazoG37] synthetase (radical SAM superfamily)
LGGISLYPLSLWHNDERMISEKTNIPAPAEPVRVNTVYGPVWSWRVGFSLGVDLICVDSVCSFNCTYCQLGFIQVRINERRLYVTTGKVMRDLEESRWRESDVITFSGSGEPTLALNLGEATREIGAFTRKPTLVLTNGTLLHLPEVRKELHEADRIYVKLDAATEETFGRINRPVPGVTLSGIVENVLELRQSYPGMLGVQMMFTRVNLGEVDEFARILNRIRPEEVQLNTPTRPYPEKWVLQTRGSHGGVDYPAKPLKTISLEQACALEARLRELTGLNIISVYKGCGEEDEKGNFVHGQS